jgi:hypothetical protein
LINHTMDILQANDRAVADPMIHRNTKHLALLQESPYSDLFAADHM